MGSLATQRPARNVFLFGPQALSLDSNAVDQLRSHLHETPGNQWALECVSGLPDYWKTLIDSIPKLQHLPGPKLLEELKHGLQKGNLSDSIFPLPNILLSPLVVITHLTQYSAALSALLPGLTEEQEFPFSVTGDAVTLGLCTGALSASVVRCSSNLKELQKYGAAAVRLAMAIGALVDAEELAPESDGDASSFSVSWNASQTINSVNQVLGHFPDAYISVFLDERRVTVTASKKSAASIIQQLKLSGLYVVEFALSGRFHWKKHEQSALQLLRLCDSSRDFQLPENCKMVLSSIMSPAGQDQLTGSIHEMVLGDILIKPSQWFTTFSRLVHPSRLSAEYGTVLCFGPERCAPPTITSKLGSRLVHLGDMNSATSLAVKALLGPRSLPSPTGRPDDRIAVVGMSCHVPGAEDLDKYWEILSRGQSQHSEVPTERFGMETAWRKLESNRKWFGNFIKDFDTFDHKFFKKSPREMSSTDPQQRLVLKLAYQAVEQAGYFASPELDKHIGCYIGVGNVDYDRNIACYPANAYSATGNLRSFIAGKVSHYFGWTGPSLTIDTACSSSGVAVHQACRAIISGECTSALAGGVNIFTSPEWFHNLAGASFLSTTGQCKPFDASGDGYCRGEGGGAVYLKRLSSAIADGDQVLGVVAGTRVYQNQNCTAITVPNAASLSELFVDVVQQARLQPHNISAVEAHGTGTPVGDPAEYDAIRKALAGRNRTSALSLMSVKGLLGHTEFASGVISLVKTLLMINEGFIPPQASFNSISPGLKATSEDQIEIQTSLKPWDVDFRAALINNYGASGSNASMVVTEEPNFRSRRIASLKSTSTQSFPFWLCGFDEQSLRTYAATFKKFLQQHSSSTNKDLSMRNLSFQLARQSNRNLPQSLIFSADSLTNLDHRLSTFAAGDKTVGAPAPKPTEPPVILCFGGQISTFIGLDKNVFDHTAILRGHLDKCDAVCLSLGLESIYPDIFERSPANDIIKLQTMLFATQYSCARAWIDCGLKVAALVGHSFGELTALCVAGAYSVEDSLKLISGRARLIRDNWGADGGSMLAVEADLSDAKALLSNTNQMFGNEPDVSIACYNGARSFTLAGSSQGIQQVEDLAKSDSRFSGMKMKKLNVTNAFHSALVDPLVKDLEDVGRKIPFKEPTLRVERATKEASSTKLEANFVAQHMRCPVYFHDAVQRLSQEFHGAVWLEAGSNSTITTMASRSLGNPSSAHFQGVNITTEGSFKFLVDNTMRLWKKGLNVSFWPHHAAQIDEYTPVMLPPYQFERYRHWMDLKEASEVESVVLQDRPHPPEVITDLTTFVGYQDEAKTTARFQVNTGVEKFQQPTLANNVNNAVAIAPVMLHVEIALYALSSLRPDLRDLNYQPEVRGVSHRNALVAYASDTVFLDVVSRDDLGLTWEWVINSVDSRGTISSEHSSGNVAFTPVGDARLKDNYDNLARLSGRERCVKLLQGDDADDVLQGRNIYRAFQQVVDYKDPLRCVTKIAGKGSESAGRVKGGYRRQNWMDGILTEGFCQVAGIFVNLMTDVPGLQERESFFCDGFSQWIRNPKMGSNTSPAADWEVFAVHHLASNSRYISDVFAFDASDGSLTEVILGVSYQSLSLADMLDVSPGVVRSEPQLQPNTLPATTAETRAHAPLKPPLASAPPPSTEQKKMATVTTAPKNERPEVYGKILEVVCNLSGLEPEDIKEDSDLAELGIDSLMAMELVREVDAALKCTLNNDQLMDLTDFRSLVSCVRTTLGLGNEVVAQGSEDDASPTTDAAKVASTTIGATTQSQIDGGVSGAVETNGVNGNSSLVNGNNVNGHLPTPTGEDTVLDASVVLDTFAEVAWATDGVLEEQKLSGYIKQVVPRTTELCVAYVVDAFEQLGCPIRSATSGQRLERVSYLPKHEKLMKLVYQMLEVDARLVDIDESGVTRTSIAPPARSAEALLDRLLKDEPAHACDYKLAALVGCKFADLITGKDDGIQLIFGRPESREIAGDFYAKSPFTGVWIRQLVSFFEKLIERLPKDGTTIRILEVGAGTGGTTCQLLPLLARLGMPVKYTMTDISGSLVAAARKRFKSYPFMEFKNLDLESDPDPKLVQSQHIILATNCIHATRSLSTCLKNIHRMLRPDGFLMLLEMTQQIPWIDFVFGLLEGWWLFEDERDYVLASLGHWTKVLHSVGFGHVDATRGDHPEANLQRLIVAGASKDKHEPARRPSSSAHVAPQLSLPDNNPERQKIVDDYVRKYTQDFRPPLEDSSQLASDSSSSNGSSTAQCVLVTGATGSLGSHIVAALAQRPDVHTVICVNRLSNADATTRQLGSFEMRGIKLDSSSISKLNVMDVDTSKPLFGLSPDKYSFLVENVTHIVHSAWPMSLTRPIRTYEIQFKIFRNLIDLATSITDYRPMPFRLGFQFVSSIAVVGNYPLLTGNPRVPEQQTTVESVPLTGYAEGKLVCENVLSQTLYRYPNRFHAMATRIAQISGSTTNGYWNNSEYMPFLIKSSQALKLLPELDGTLSWYPVDDVAATLGDLLLSDTSRDLIYHIDNPSRQAWKDMIASLARALNLGPESIVPFNQWTDRIRRLRGSTTDNPALQLIDFFENYFIPMSCGDLILDTTKANQHSETLRNEGPIGENLVQKYVDALRQSGFLNT